MIGRSITLILRGEENGIRSKEPAKSDGEKRRKDKKCWDLSGMGARTGEHFNTSSVFMFHPTDTIESLLYEQKALPAWFTESIINLVINSILREPHFRSNE